MMGYGFGFGWLFMLIGGLLFIGIIVLVIYFLVRAANAGRSDLRFTNDSQHENTNRALEILAERYARGEINDEEYKQKKIELRKP